MDQTAIVVAALSALVALASTVLTYRASRRANAVGDEANRIQWVKEMRAAAADARREAAEAHEQMSAVRREARALADELHRLRTAIMSPDSTVESLRLLVTTMGPN